MREHVRRLWQIHPKVKLDVQKPPSRSLSSKPSTIVMIVRVILIINL